MPKNTAKLRFSSYSQHTEITHEIIGRALLNFLNSALEAILYHETARMKTYEYLKISETFILAMVSKHSSQGLPLFLVVTLRETEEFILEVLLWAQYNQTLDSSHIVGVIQKFTISGRQGAQYQWSPGILKSSVLGMEKTNGARENSVFRIGWYW